MPPPTVEACVRHSLAKLHNGIKSQRNKITFVKSQKTSPELSVETPLHFLLPGAACFFICKNCHVKPGVTFSKAHPL